MAVDDSVKRAKSMSASTHRLTKAELEKLNKKQAVPTRLGHLLARKHRIERWAYSGRSSSNNDTATTTSAALGTSSAQKRSENSYSQVGRILDIQLIQLSEQRQKLIERNNFDQKLFANKQALKYKDNPNLLRTLSYVRKCCKYADRTDNEKEKINPAIFLDENATIKRSRSRSPTTTSPTIKRSLSANPRTQMSTTIAQTFLDHNKKHFETSSSSSPIHRRLTSSRSTNHTPTTTHASVASNDDDSQKRHVQFRIHNKGIQLTSQSAREPKKSHSNATEKQIIRQVASANGLRSLNSTPDTRTSSNSAPLIRTAPSTTESLKTNRSITRIKSAHNALEEFRRHPEQFLSASNRYLPLLHRQALEAESRALSTKQQREKNDVIRKPRVTISPPVSRLSTASDYTYDDAKSFLSEENDNEKPIQAPAWLEQARKEKKIRISSKLSFMDDMDLDDEEEHRTTLSRLRDREYAHMQQLIRSNPIEHILEPFSAIKTDEIEPIDPKEHSHPDYHRSSITSNVDPSLSTAAAAAASSALKATRIRRLSEILRSIDSLRCSDTVDKRARRKIDIEKNREKLGILIF